MQFIYMLLIEIWFKSEKKGHGLFLLSMNKKTNVTHIAVSYSSVKGGTQANSSISFNGDGSFSIIIRLLLTYKKVFQTIHFAIKGIKILQQNLISIFILINCKNIKNYAKWNKPGGEGQIPYDLTFNWNLINKTNKQAKYNQRHWN